MGNLGKYHRWLEEHLEKPFLRAELLQLESPNSEEKNPPLVKVITSSVTLIVLMALWGGIN